MMRIPKLSGDTTYVYLMTKSMIATLSNSLFAFTWGGDRKQWV
jgi:hypothetical protein